MHTTHATPHAAASHAHCGASTCCYRQPHGFAAQFTRSLASDVKVTCSVWQNARVKRVVCQRIRVRPLSVEPLAWQLGPSGRIRGCGCAPTASCVVVVVIVAALNAGLVQPHLLLGALHPSHTSPLLPTTLATVPPLSSLSLFSAKNRCASWWCWSVCSSSAPSTQHHATAR
jgi:hypothetical protein